MRHTARQSATPATGLSQPGFSAGAQPDRATLLLACALADQPMAWPADGPAGDAARRRPSAGVLCLPAAQAATAPAAGWGAGSGPSTPADPAAAQAQAQARAQRRIALLRQVVAHQPGGRWPLMADTLAPALATSARPVLLRRLFDALEAHRVDGAIARLYPGARADLARVQGAAPRGLWAPRLAGLAAASPQLLAPCASAADSLAAAQRACAGWIATHGPGRRAAPAAPGPGLRLRAPDTPDGLAGPTSASTSPGSPTATAWGDGQSDSGQTQPIDGQSLARWPGHPPDPARQPGADAAERDSRLAAPTDATRQPAQPPAQAQTRAPDRPPPRPASPNADQHWYDEWDMTLQRYRRAWTCVQVRPAPAGDPAYLRSLHLRHAALRRAIQRQFAATPPQARARGGPAAEGDQIDLDQAIHHLIDRRAGSLGEARPYRHRPKARRDVCTAVLLDMSGSTGFAVPPRTEAVGTTGDPPMARTTDANDDDDDLLYGFRPRTGPPAPAPRRVIDIAHDAIALVCDGMALLGDRHAVWGFSGRGRLQVDLRQAKAFDAPWGSQSAAALAALQPQGSTRTGAAIRHAVAQLRQQPERTRVLIVVTDGYPQDEDYGPDPRDRRYGLEDTAMALREAERAGVAAFCVSVDQAAHDYLRGVCPARRYLVIDDVHRLPQQLAQLYRRLTTA